MSLPRHGLQCHPYYWPNNKGLIAAVLKTKCPKLYFQPKNKENLTNQVVTSIIYTER